MASTKDSKVLGNAANAAHKKNFAKVYGGVDTAAMYGAKTTQASKVGTSALGSKNQKYDMASSKKKK